ncbi:MAG TPA: helix-turn-helix domain-containing protein, partial [Vicinamibacterales bacterium]|nr:helix-turn-helix domain-containing protein [Vicinamibacterales bacterium]
DYVLNLRIEEAKRLLETSDRPVDDISATVGYEDASFFRRVFKRRTGLVPLHYRRMFQPIRRRKLITNDGGGGPVRDR